jgi:tRNA-specific 2-thiouridylase
MKKKILAAMSGGVDSSAAAILLQEQGYEVVGATVKMFGNKDVGIKEPDAPKQDVEDAKTVAEKLGIEHHVLDFSSCFKKCVINHFVNEYKCGRTPNPCVDCNKHIKFGKLFEAARELGCEYLATGHYARIEYSAEKDRWLLARGDDASKDQSYMLFNMTQDQLAHTVLPLAELTKAEIRSKADEAGLAVAHKSDSQDICFVPDGDYAAVIARLGVKSKQGNFVHMNGTVLGKHKGQLHYTIGQRKGLGVSYEYPLYVISKDMATNTVVLGPNDALFSKELWASAVNFITVDKLTEPMRVTAKARYRMKDVSATIEPAEDGLVHVIFDEPQRAITPGQAVVFYDGQYVVGGGIIER